MLDSLPLTPALAVLLAVAVFSLAVLAAARLTRMVVHDAVLMPVRALLAEREGRAARMLSYLMSCTWCSAVWTCGVTVAYAHHLTGAPWVYYPLTMLAAAWIVPVLAHWTED